MNNSKYTEIEKKRKITVFTIIAVVVFGYIFINFIYKPYLTTKGRQSRLWDEQKKKTMEALGIACYLKKDNPIYIRLEAECENWKKGKEIYTGVGNPDYFPDNISVELPEAPPFGG